MSDIPDGWVDWYDYLSDKEANDYQFGSPAIISKFAILFAKQAVIMEEIPVDLGSKRMDLSRPLLMGISSNAQAIVKLAKDNFGNEVYPISRCLIERIITFYYLQYCNETEIQNYIDYSIQKTFRKLNRSIKINDKIFSLKHSSDVDISKFHELKSAVEKYTSKKSKKPITHWSGTSIEKKLSVIDSSNEVNIAILMMTLEAVFDDGSEALHGTLYGCTFHLGAYKPGVILNTPQDMSKHHQENLTMVFFLFGCLLSELNLYVAKKLDLSKTLKVSESTYSQIKHTMELSIGKPT